MALIREMRPDVLRRYSMLAALAYPGPMGIIKGKMVHRHTAVDGQTESRENSMDVLRSGEARVI